MRKFERTLITLMVILCLFCSEFVTIAASETDQSTDLAGLSVNCGTLSPAFNPNVTSYTVNFYDVADTIVRPVASDIHSSITVNGKTCLSGSSCIVSLSPGCSIYIVVTAQSGISQCYTVTASYKLPTVVGLSCLAISPGSLSPAFATETSSYSATVDNSVTSVTLTPTAIDSLQTITVNNVVINNGSRFSLPLSVGENSAVITVSVTGGASKTYVVSVTRSKSPTSSETGGAVGLSGLAISSGSLSPAFATATSLYSAAVENSVTSVTLAPVAIDSSQTITVNNVTVGSGSGFSLPLSVGENSAVITVSVTGGSSKTYIIRVTRAVTSSVGLSSLVISSGSLSPAFATTTLSYSATVENSATKLYIDATASDASASVKINGGTSTSVSLNLGYNTITITVTASDATVKTYTITVLRSYAEEITVTTQNADGAYCAAVPDYVAVSGNSDAFTFVLGGDTIVMPVTILKNYKGTGTLTVSRSESTQATMQMAAAAALANCTISGGVDINLSGGSSSVSCPINSQVTLRLKSGVKAALKEGIPEIYYFNAATGSLVDTNAVFDMTGGTVTFTAVLSGTYVFADKLSGAVIDYTVAADSNFSSTGTTSSFNVSIVRGSDSIRLDGAQLMVVTTLLSGLQTVNFNELTGDSCKITVSVDGQAVQSIVYLINGTFDSSYIPKTYALTQFVKA